MNDRISKIKNALKHYNNILYIERIIVLFICCMLIWGIYDNDIYCLIGMFVPICVSIMFLLSLVEGDMLQCLNSVIIMFLMFIFLQNGVDNYHSFFIDWFWLWVNSMSVMVVIQLIIKIFIYIYNKLIKPIRRRKTM